MKKSKEILAQLQKREFAPIYFLVGEKETFFVDQLSNYIEENVLSEEEKGFNQQIMYGRDVSMMEVIEAAKRFPMMAEYQVIIVREAQHLARELDKLEDYVANMQPSTILVFCYKYKKPDGRKKVISQIKKKAVYYETSAIYDNMIGDWIVTELAQKQYSIDPKAAQMLIDFLGNDLSKIYKELEKLMQILPLGSRITPESVEENIGISKDYNVFELVKAIGDRDEVKAFKIAAYFEENPKNNPLILTVGQVFRFFQNLLLYHSLTDKSNVNVARELKISPYFVKDYITASRFYPMKKVSKIIAHLRDLDLASKGVGSKNTDNGSILREFLVKTMR